jgi:hypothetical protein
MATEEEKIEKIRKAYDEFMAGLQALEHERLDVMKKVIGEAEQEEIRRILEDLKRP